MADQMYLPQTRKICGKRTQYSNWLRHIKICQLWWWSRKDDQPTVSDWHNLRLRVLRLLSHDSHAWEEKGHTAGVPTAAGTPPFTATNLKRLSGISWEDQLDRWLHVIIVGWRHSLCSGQRGTGTHFELLPDRDGKIASNAPHQLPLAKRYNCHNKFPFREGCSTKFHTCGVK